MSKPGEQRIAVCDLGSNSFRLVVFSSLGQRWRRTDEIYEPVRIGAGMALFGADSSVGWRFATALFGTLAVLLLYVVALTLTRSIGVATAAAGLMAIDGLAIVLSRVALLDTFVMFFTLLALNYAGDQLRRRFDVKEVRL